jgi:hypothetical protein
MISTLSYAECTLYKVDSILNSNDLATQMGKARIFDIDLMTRYQDDAPIAQGEVMKFEHHFFKTEIIKGERISDNEYQFQLENGYKFITNAKERKIASLEKVKLCK